jgi:uncharacterized cupredoxin-like copper-binding protein
MKKTLTALAAALAITGAGLASAGNTPAENAAIVKAADWKTMKTITVSLDEFSYDGDMSLTADQPYKIELKNVGEKKHYFTAPEFFKNIATRKAQVNGQAEIKADYFNALEILPGGQLDIYFVATTKGEYPVYCTIDDHRDEGMDEVITVK